MFRKAAQTYHVPNDSLTIEKGQKLIIPIYSLHYDPKYYTDPELFDPERFSSEEKAKRVNGTYLPFGDGPRICIGIRFYRKSLRKVQTIILRSKTFIFMYIIIIIGKRFAEMEMKLGLSEILSKFEVEPCEKTEIPIKFSKKSIVAIPENGIWLRFKKITD